MTYRFTSPTKIIIPRKTKKDKTYYLNLNSYRNWNFIVSNIIKKAYLEVMLQTKIDFKQHEEIKIIYEYYRKDKRNVDMMNVISVVDKFFQDYLVHIGLIPDDNTKHVKDVHCVFKGQDPEKKGKIEIAIVTE